MQHKQRKVKNTPRKRNRTFYNLKKATQEVANGIAGICHVIQDNGGGVRHSYLMS